jgi:hypothetical protein
MQPPLQARWTDVGSWDWAQRTGGRLGRRDRAELLRQGVLARLQRLPGPWRAGILEHARDLAIPEPPDTQLAVEADALVRLASPPALYGHCLRTWAFADLFAQRDRVDHDPEMLFVASVMHDLGLTSAHDRNDESAACFAVEGARAARCFALERGMPSEQATVVAEAISLHANITVPDRHGAVASLLSKGVSLDAIGRRLEQLPPQAIAMVTTRWPRDGTAAALSGAIEAQARVRPSSRAQLLHRLGINRLSAANPLDRP